MKPGTMRHRHKFEFSPFVLRYVLQGQRRLQETLSCPSSRASLSDSTASLLSSLLATPTHTPSHSRCWNSLPFLMRVPECLIKVVQPSKSESFTVGRANIYSINKRWVLARGRHCWSLGHRTCHRSTWNCMASDCSCYSQTSHGQWQYAQCFIQCQLKR